MQLRVSERRLVLMAGDALAVILAVVIALYIWSLNADDPFDVDFVLPQSYWFFVLTILWLVLASANDFYELSLAANRVASLQRLGLITGQMLIVYLMVFFLSPRDALPRLFILYYGMASFLLIGIWRVINPALVGWAAAARRVLIVGADESAVSLIRAIQHHGGDAYDVRGIIGAHEDVGRMIEGVPVLGSGSDLLNYVLRDQVSEVVVTSIPEMDGDVFRDLMQAYEHGVSIVPMPLLYARITGRVPVKYVNNNWALVLPVAGHTIFNPYPAAQRVMDVILSLIGLVVLVILLPFIALLIRLDSPGPVFYRQVRTGLNGQNFRLVKFRTMVANAEHDGRARFAEPGDPRVTRVGRFLRKSRLDELPQVMNVLRGQMSVVGPRPERPEHIDRLTENIPFYRTRLVVRPGLTGWAQVQYHYGSDDVDALVKLEYDLYYIRNQSILLDINIIIRTVYKVLRLGGL
ncbi:MAG: sugar transferase [Phototrophicaceae bacterium]